MYYDEYGAFADIDEAAAAEDTTGQGEYNKETGEEEASNASQTGSDNGNQS